MRTLLTSHLKIFMATGALIGLVVLMVLPPLLFVPDIRDKDFPHSGVVLRVTDTGFVLGGKHKDRELVVTTTASTTIGGEVTIGEFVQVFGVMETSGQVTADRVQVMEGPRKINREDE